MSEEERRRGRYWWTLLLGKGEETISSVLKVPRQYPFVLLVEAMHIIRFNFVI
jgi:hypothetical protein